jgi:hypothetical protein
MVGFSIPQDFPLSELANQELTNLSIGRHYLRMSFIRIKAIVAGTPKYEDGASIEIEAGFEFLSENGEVVTANNSDLASGAASLIQLLGQTITSVQRSSNNELRLQFSNRTSLLLKVDAQGFESYHLHIAGQSVDVTME